MEFQPLCLLIEDHTLFQMWYNKLVGLRTACTFVRIDNDNIPVNHSNVCICNFVKITGCDFTYLAPVVSHQLIKANYTIYHKLSPTPIGMNLTLVRQLIKHQDLMDILKKAQKSGKKTLITVHHDMGEISRVLLRVGQNASHYWWDVLFGWSPTTTGILNTLLHPIIVLLTLVGISFVFSIVLFVWNWRMLQRVTALTSLSKAHGKALKDTFHRSSLGKEPMYK